MFVRSMSGCVPDFRGTVIFRILVGVTNTRMCLMSVPLGFKNTIVGLMLSLALAARATLGRFADNVCVRFSKIKADANHISYATVDIIMVVVQSLNTPTQSRNQQ